jgi:hypothetical protein
MSEATIEAIESEWESSEAEMEGEGSEATFEGYDSEASEASFEAYPEDARSDARRRARQRQIMLARRRQAQLRRPSAPVRIVTRPSPAVRAVRSEVRGMDMQTQVALDSLRRRLNEANRLAYRNAWAAEASVAASQVLDSFDSGLKDHDWARAIIRSAPTLVLAPGRRQPGLQGILLDPRVAGGALITAIWAFGHFRNEAQGVSSVQVKEAGSLTVGGTTDLRVLALDKAGNQVSDSSLTYTLTVDDSSILTFTQTSPGQFTLTGVSAGSTWVTATVGGKSFGRYISVGA